MKYLNIIFKILIIICLGFLILIARKMALESNLIYDRYVYLHNTIAEKNCYKDFEEVLKTDMLKTENIISTHTGHADDILSSSIVLSIFIFIVSIGIIIFEILKNK